MIQLFYYGIILFLLLLLFGIAVFFIVRLISLLMTSYYGSPYVPLELEMVMSALEFAEVKSGETILDLGSGDGRILIESARRFGTKGIGWELVWYPFFLSKFNVFRSGFQNDIQIFRKNMFEGNFPKTDAIVLYQQEHILTKLLPRFLSDFPKKSRIVTARFQIPGQKPFKTNIDHKYPLYYYRVSELS